MSFQQKVSETKSFPGLTGPYSCPDLCFISPQPDTSQSCKTTDMEPVLLSVNCKGCNPHKRTSWKLVANPGYQTKNVAN